VFGNNLRLSYRQHKVIKALVDVFPGRLTSPELEKVNSDGPRLIRDLRDTDRLWQEALSTPDHTKGRGFGIVALPPHFP
jgi:hypothetical protein